MNPNQLTVREHLLLYLVNEKGQDGISKETCCHEAYGRQTAIDIVEETLDQLWEHGLVVNLGHYRGYKYYITKKGSYILTHYLRPLPDLKLG